MQKTLLIDGLKKLGLTEVEARGYLALIERDALTTSEIAKISDLNRTTSYDVVKSLMDKGLCSYIPGKVKKYQAIDIDQVAQQIIEKNKQECQKTNNLVEKTAGSIKLKLKKAYAQKRDNNPLDYIEVVKTPNQIHRTFIELLANTQKEVLIFVKPPHVSSTAKQRDEQFKAQDEATARGVIARGIIELPPEDQIEAFFDQYKTKPSANIGDEIRIIDKLPIKLMISDNTTCIFTLEDPIIEEHLFTMLITKHTAIAATLKLLFDLLWEKATDYYVYKGHKYYLPKRTK